MKGVVIYDKSNDIAFLQSDDELCVYLNGVATEKGMMRPGDQEPLNRDMVMQLLSPFMTSQRFLIDNLSTAYHSIQTEDGHLFVFLQFEEYIYIAINGDGTESENFLTRKLAILNRIIHFTLGPLLNELNPETMQKRSERWNFIGQLLTSWCQLYNSEESFLLEALERLNVNTELNCKCIGFLEWAFTTMKSKDNEAIHSMLFVNNKLLSLYSDSLAPPVDDSDMMMIIIWIQSLFPTSSASSSSHLSKLKTPRNSDDFDEQSEVIPGNKDSSSLKIRSNSTSEDKDLGVRNGPVNLPNNDIGEKQDRRSRRQSKEPTDDSTAAGDQYERSGSKDESIEDEPTSFEKHVVFLHRGSTAYVPHVLYCVPLAKDITLVFICQIPRVEDSMALAKLLEVINALLTVQWPQRIGSAAATVKLLESSIKTVLNITHHYDNVDAVKQPIQVVGDRWKEINSATLVKCLEEAEASKELEQRVHYSLQQMYTQVRDLVCTMFFVPRKMTAEDENNMEIHLKSIQSGMTSSLHDYRKFLRVKSLYNCTLTSYLEKFPGLIHFMYVDRTRNQLTATSFSVDSDRNSDKAQLLIIQRNLWKLIEQMHQNLLQGCLSTTLCKGDYYYNYCLWFEDSSGKVLPLQVPFRTTRKFLLPGIIAHNFYRKLKTRCFPKEKHPINCYELITVHTGYMPKSHMYEQCKRLVSLLIQNSVVSSTPILLF